MITRLTKLLLVLSVTFLSGCQKEEAPSQDTLHFGINPWPSYELIYLAKTKGFFEEVGLDLELSTYGSLNDNRRAFERGYLDGMAGTMVELIQSYANTPHKPKVVYIPDYSNGGDVIIANSGIRTVHHLQGRTVGIETGTLNQFLLYRALEEHEMSVRDVEVQRMPQHAMVDNILDHRVDAVVSYPPISTTILGKNGFHVVFSSADIPGEVVDLLMFREDTIAKKPNAIRKFLKGYQKALQYAQNNKQDAYLIMAIHEGVDIATFTRLIEKDLQMLTAQEQKNLFRSGSDLEKSITLAEELMYNNKLIQEKRGYEAYIDRQFVE